MRNLTKKDRMQADSLPEIRQGLKRLTFDFGGVKVGSRPASEGHLLNAAILILMAMPDEECGPLVRGALERLNALLLIDQPTPEQVRAIILGTDLPVGEEAPAPDPELLTGERARGTRARPGKKGAM